MHESVWHRGAQGIIYLSICASLKDVSKIAIRFKQNEIDSQNPHKQFSHALELSSSNICFGVFVS